VIFERTEAEPSDKFGKRPEEKSVQELLSCGIINLDKPRGPTSHEVVSWVKQVLNVKKAGHSGTLDPKVTGVLPVALGRATKALQVLLLGGKEYVGVMHLHSPVAKKEVENVFKEERPAQYFAAIMSGGSAEAPGGLRERIQAVLGRAQWRASVGYLSEKATGMLKGERTYGSVAEVAVRDEAGRSVNLGYEALERVREEIQSKNPEVSRVLYFVVGKGDSEGYYVAMRAVETRDFLTAKVSDIPWSTLESAAKKILDTCKKVTKVFYDVTPKPPATVEFE